MYSHYYRKLQGHTDYTHGASIIHDLRHTGAFHNVFLLSLQVRSFRNFVVWLFLDRLLLVPNIAVSFFYFCKYTSLIKYIKTSFPFLYSSKPHLIFPLSQPIHPPFPLKERAGRHETIAENDKKKNHNKKRQNPSCQGWRKQPNPIGVKESENQAEQSEMQLLGVLQKY